MSSLRVVTYNTQLRSRLMEMFADLNPFTTFTAPRRAEIIAERIRSSEYDYDVVALNEVFCEDSRVILWRRLGQKYRHAIPMLGSRFIGEDSGLMLFSRFPFEDVPTQPGQKILFEVFRENEFPDSLKVFDIIYATTKGGPVNATMTFHVQGYIEAIEDGNRARGMVFLFVLWFLCFVFSKALTKLWAKVLLR